MNDEPNYIISNRLLGSLRRKTVCCAPSIEVVQTDTAWQDRLEVVQSQKRAAPAGLPRYYERNKQFKLTSWNHVKGNFGILDMDCE